MLAPASCAGIWAATPRSPASPWRGTPRATAIFRPRRKNWRCALPGAKLWGVLRGEIDDYGNRVRRASSVEEHVSLSMTYQQFLAGEIELLCSHADYFRRVTVLEAGSADFALFGSWDALAGFARELERVFARFAEENLKDLPGAEAKTMTMALTLAEPATPLGARLGSEHARSCRGQGERQGLFLHPGSRPRVEAVERRRGAERRAGPAQRGVPRRPALYGAVAQSVPQGGIARSRGSGDERLMVRAARFQRRFSGVANRREREFLKLRANLMKEMTGRKSRGKLRLKPEGLVALEWARLLAKTKLRYREINYG